MANIYFISTACYRKQPYFDAHELRKLLCASLQNCTALYDAQILGYVIISNQVQFILHINGRDLRIKFLHSFKLYTSSAARQFLIMQHPKNALRLAYQYRAQTYKIWEDGYFWREIKTFGECGEVIDSMHKLPLMMQSEETGCALEYAFSSAGFYAGSVGGMPEVVDYRAVFS